MTRVLITGAGGFVGSHLMDAYPDAVGFDNFLTGRRENNARVLEVDITLRHLLYALPNDTKRDVVIHCSASYSDPDLWHPPLSDGGRSSGPIVRAFAVGRPVAVSDYAQFAEYPARLVVRIPFELEVESLARFMADPTIDRESIGAAQREWLAATSTVSATVDGYERAIEARARGNRPCACHRRCLCIRQWMRFWKHTAAKTVKRGSRSA